jgi:hypothetical protein
MRYVERMETMLHGGGRTMMRRIAVVGDTLLNGGTVLSYAGPACTFGNAGHQVALIGGQAYCEMCKSVGIITKAGGPRRMKFMGEVALDGDEVLCKCLHPKRIVAVLAGEAWYEDMGGARGTHYQSGADFSEAAQANSLGHYDLFFHAKHEQTGKNLCHVGYRITLEDGRQFVGVTDENGYTLNVAADRALNAKIEIPYYDNSPTDTSSESEPCAC